MKKVLSYILISLIISANLLAPISLGLKSNKQIKIQKNEVLAAPNDCVINKADWSTTGDAKTAKPNPLSLSISTSNCINRTLTIMVWETGGIDKNLTTISNVKITKDDTVINFTAGEQACSNGVCEINTDIFVRDPNSMFGEVSKTKETLLIYKCDNSQCNEALPWTYSLEAGSKLAGDYSFEINPIIKTNDTTATVDISVKNNSVVSQTVIGATVINAKLGIKVDLKNIDGSIKETKIEEMASTGGTKNFTFGPLVSNTDYIIQISIVENSTISSGMYSSNNDRVIATVPDKKIHTGVPGKQELIDQGPVETVKMDSTKEIKTMPACGIATPMGCVAQFFYYVLFVPTSYLFALAGTFFDYTFAYSVNDTSYRSAFVVQGWGLVRDFCNMFFIFIMLYIAISTILSVHGFKTKETIINVVIIGLFINFSLFATQLIIDASNITARVFYNSDAIKITVKGQSDNTATNIVNGTASAKEGEGGVISLSEALVNKVNPQNIIINSKKINDISPVNGNSVIQDTQSENNMTAGTFILIVFLAVAINVVGIIVFLSVGLIFVTRVIGLWLAMIMAPLAFFTYITPGMAKTKMIGWENWWPETIKLAFLAPVFIFFMYIILKFLELDLISDPSKTNGLGFFVATIIPFAFIMILMLKAKSLASDMSGEFGQKITGGIAAAGGMMLGGAALGTAFLGRRVVGAGIASMSRGAADHDMQRAKFDEKLSAWKSSKSKKKGPAPTWEQHLEEAKAKGEKTGNGWNPVSNYLGRKLNEKQRNVNKIDHARHEMDEAKKAAGLVDAKGNILEDEFISGEDNNKLQTTFNKTKRSEVETNARKGLDATGKEKLTGDLAGGEEAFRSKNRQDEIDKVKALKDPNLFDGKELTDAGKKKVENELNLKLNDTLKTTTDAQLSGMFTHLKEESKQNVSILTRGFARSNKASYDVRNISEVKSDKRDGFFSKVPTAMIAGVALGVRGGLKSSGINHGQGQADVLKDIGSTITEALKGIKVEVPKAPGGGGHGGGDAHGGAAAHH